MTNVSGKSHLGKRYLAPDLHSNSHPCSVVIQKLDKLGIVRLEDGKRSYHGYHEEIVVDQGIKTTPIKLPPGTF